MHKNYKFFESLHRFLGRPSLLVVFVRNHGVHLSMRAGQRSDCIVLTFCTICCLRFRWRSHQSVNLYFAASSSLRQVDLCIHSTQVSFGRRLTPTMSLSILLLLVRRSLSVSAHIVQHDDPVENSRCNNRFKQFHSETKMALLITQRNLMLRERSPAS